MTQSVCPKCEGFDSDLCDMCKGDGVITIEWDDDEEEEEIERPGPEQCEKCQEYLDDDGTCPQCDTDSLGRNLDHERKLKEERRARDGDVDIERWSREPY
jgi:hypothetical protein